MTQIPFNCTTHRRRQQFVWRFLGTGVGIFAVVLIAKAQQTTPAPIPTQEVVKTVRQSSPTKEKPKLAANILHQEAFFVMGTVTRIKIGSESTEQFMSIWQDFESYYERIKSFSIDQNYYGVSFHTDQEMVFDYLAGMAVAKMDTVPKGLELRTVPQAEYAVFSCSVQTIGETYGFIFGQWLPTSNYTVDSAAASFEKYPVSGDNESPVLIFIPIQASKK